MFRLFSTSPFYSSLTRCIRSNIHRISPNPVSCCNSSRLFHKFENSRKYEEPRRKNSDNQWRHKYQRNERRSQGNGSAPLFFLPAFTIWENVQYVMGWGKPKLDDDEIKNKIKYAMFYCRENKHEDALVVLHEALEKAGQDQNESAINYCIDMMANIYYYLGRYDEAEMAFGNLIQRILASGDKADGVSAATSPAMVELSLKLADIYAMKGDDEKAVSGFEFCIATQKMNLDNAITDYNRQMAKVEGSRRHDMNRNPEESDPFALYGLVLETYARYLARKGRVEESQPYLNRALEMALEVYGSAHPHTLAVMNNYAVICISQGRFDIAETYLKDVVIRAPLSEGGEAFIAGYYTNYAETLWHLGRQGEALEYAKKASKLVSDQSVSPEVRKRTEDYVKRLEADWRRESKKKSK